MRIGLIFAGLCMVANGATAGPEFVNKSAALGLIHQYTGGWEFFVGGGVASFDCNNDHLPELFLAGGAGGAVLLRNRSRRGHGVNLQADTPAALKLKNVTGAYPLDVDSDGTLDLFVMRVGENRLLKGGPDCSFTPFDAVTLPTGSRWTTAFSATWESGNFWPTMAIGNYVDRNNPKGPFEACDVNYLMRPVAGKYTRLPLAPGFCPLSMLFSDWGRQGRADLRISNDRHYYVRGGSEQMWAMEPKPRLYTAADGWRDYALWGMGIASRDITGDGLPEVFLTSMGDQKMQALDTSRPGPVFKDATYERGTTAHRPYVGGDGRPSTGWHVAFGDVDNDGRDDVFIAKGNVEQMPDSAMADPNNLLMQGNDGTFTEHGLQAGIATLERSRGAALVDLNLDGKLDLVVVNRRAAVEVYQNETPDTGNWVQVEIVQNGTNPQAVSAWVEMRDGGKIQSREITVGGGHASGNAGLLHFGLGRALKVEMRVIWPDKTVSQWQEVPLNQFSAVVKDGPFLRIKPY